jgi:hypothetical protein
MGRPLSKQKMFGANNKNNIKVQFHNGTTSVKGYILEQTGSKRFKCIDVDGNEAVCYLKAKSSNELEEGEMSITVLDDNENAYQITKIARHRVSYNGISAPWTFEANLGDGYVQMEEAGTDDAMTDAIDLEGDEPTGPTIPPGMDPDEPLAGSGGSNNTVPGTFTAASSYIDAYDATEITFRDITASGLTSVTNSTSGLIRQKYVGNFSTTYIKNVSWGAGFNMNFFVPANGPISTDALEVDTYTGFGLRTDLGSENGYAFEWKGYIQAPVTGNMQFFSTVDDDVVVWMGAPALNPANNNYLLAKSGAVRDGTDGVTVQALKWYPVRIWFQEFGGAEKMQLGANNSVNSTLYGLGTGATQFTVAHNSATRGY